MLKLHTLFICFCRIQFYSLWHSVWHYKCGQHKAKKGLWLTTQNKNSPSSVRVFFCFVVNFIQRFLPLKKNIPKRIELEKKRVHIEYEKVRNKKQKFSYTVKSVCVCVHINRKLTNIATNAYVYIYLHLFNILLVLYLSSSIPKPKSLLLFSFFLYHWPPKWMRVSVCVHSLAIWFVTVCRIFFLFWTRNTCRGRKKVRTCT